MLRSRFFNYDLPQDAESRRDELAIGLRGYDPLRGKPIDVQQFAVGIRSSNGDLYSATGKMCMGGENDMMRTCFLLSSWPIIIQSACFSPRVEERAGVSI